MKQRHLHRAKLGRRLHDPVDGSLLVLRVRCGAAVSWCVATVATVATVLVVAVVVVVVVVTVDVVLVVVVAALSAAAGTAAGVDAVRCGLLRGRGLGGGRNQPACSARAVRCCAVLCGGTGVRRSWRGGHTQARARRALRST